MDGVVAENGAVVHFPGSGYTSVLAAAAPGALVAELRRRGIRAAAGQTIIEAAAADAQRILDTIHQQELPLVLLFNRSRLMILPQGMSKATGLQVALNMLRLSLAVRGRNVLIAGDARSGKSWLAGLLAEQLILHGYSICVIDPDGRRGRGTLTEARNGGCTGKQEEALMRMRWMAAAVLVVAVLTAWGAAQQPQPAAPDMMKMHEQMMAEMKANDAKLDALVAQMNAASGPARVDAVAAVVTELVRQQKAMHQHMGQMHGQMMGRGMMGGRG